jgi:hypothetical protein
MVMFKFISDPGHGWLEVNLKDFPFAQRSATGFGFKNGDFIYLEEDVEANDFLVELRQRGIAFDITEEILDEEWEGRNYEPSRKVSK